MNTFPYDSWEAAIEAADGTTGYFTWGPGGNAMSVFLAIVGIAVSVVSAVLVTTREDKLLNHAAERLASKYS